MNAILSAVGRNQELQRLLFPHFFRSREQRRAIVAKQSARSIHPDVLRVLRDQNPGSSNLHALDTQPVVFVVTGQQLGYLGGPLLTLYKALTAVRVSRAIEEESGIRSIPLFWLQSEDHDFEEIRHAHFLSKEFEIQRLSLPATPAGLGGPVGSILIDSASAATTAHFLTSHFGDLAAPSRLEAVLDAYRAGNSLSHALGQLLRALLGDQGLLVFDPQVIGVKRHANDFLLRFFQDSDAIENILQTRSNVLHANDLPTTVSIRPHHPLPFVTFGGSRERIKALGRNRFHTPLGEVTADTLFDQLRQDPMRITTSALARPLLQDFLLPTVAYVGGSAEMSYWAQLSGLYEHLGVAMPMVVPRAQFALCTTKQHTTLKDLSLSIADLAKDDASLALSQMASHEHPDEIFKKSEEQLKRLMSNLSSELAHVNSPVVAEGVDRTLTSMITNLEKLKARYSRAVTEKHEILTNRIRKLRSVFLPNGKAQERVLSLTQLLLIEDPQILMQIADRIRPFDSSETEVCEVARLA